jgi:hypothetical protein
VPEVLLFTVGTFQVPIMPLSSIEGKGGGVLFAQKGG